PEIMRERRSAREGEPRDDREDGGEGDRRDEAEERGAADHLREQGRRHVAALTARGDRLTTDQDGRAEAEHERDEIEEADEAGRVEDRAARGLRIRDGVEAHEDVRQARGAEHQREPERDRLERARDELAWREDARAVLRGGGVEEAE